MNRKPQTRSQQYTFFAAVICFALVCAGLLTNLWQANAGGFNEPNQITYSDDPALPYYDIRWDKSETAQATLTALREQNGVSQRAVTDVRARLQSGETALRARVPSLKVEYSTDLRAPEVIGIDVTSNAFLTAANPQQYGAGKSNAAQMRGFVAQNKDLFGLNSKQVNALKVVADYTNPDGNLSYVMLGQELNGLPVFRGEAQAMITRAGALARIVNNLAPGLDETKLATDGGDAAQALATAAHYINRTVSAADVKITRQENKNRVVEFERGAFDQPTTAELMYFPTEPGTATLAWRVLFWQPTNAFYVIIDARSGALLWRKNISADQTQPATYNVYQDDSPAPFSPGPNNPTAGTQAPLLNRTNVTLVGNESPNSFNNLGWLTDGSTSTDGNNVEAGLDRDGANGVDTAGKAVSDTRQFVFDYNPAPGNPAPGAQPTPTAGSAISDYQKGVVTQLFYLTNIYHDRLYNVGFTEAARNFQANNFGRGGTGNDRVSAEAQDSSGTNNANFDTPADGSRGRMQMYIFTNPTPARDGSLDSDIVWHELTHGLSNRLIGNGSGLGATQSRGMGEGWSDFYARTLAATPDEPLEGLYSAGGYSTYLFRGTGFTSNYYFGIRHFPYALRSSVGPNGRPHNPLTFADIDANQVNITDGAYTAPTAWSTTSFHALGEVWCNMLLEVRARLITRLGYTEGNRRMLQLVTDALKVTPLNPNFIQSRNAILAADQASFGGADLGDIWGGFAVRGAGFGASTNGTTVVESFQLPGLQQVPTFGISDTSGNNNGFLEPGETVTLSVPVQNPSGAAINNVAVSVNGGTPVSYGNLANNQTVTRTIPYTIPASNACGASFTFNLSITGDGQTPVAITQQVILGQPIISQSVNFDDVTAPALPTGWTTAITGAGTAWVTSTTTPDTAPNALFAAHVATPGSAEITSPSYAVTSTSAQLSFRNFYNTEAGFDGGVLEISVGSGAFQDIITAGGSFLGGGYNGPISSSTDSVLAGRNAWSGDSGGYVTTSVVLPASANGQNVRFKWRSATDTGTTGPGWRVDNVRLFNGYTCAAAVSGTLQFDGGTFAAGEGNSTALITVTRTGATSGATARVNYSTADGTASQRTDYVITGGTLEFAAGETSKTFTISLVDDVYQEGNETVSLSLSGLSGAAAGSTTSATLTIQDNDTATPTANPSDGAQFFVRQHYLDFLNREPDAGGLAYWTGQITQCGSDVACQRQQRRAVSAAFFIELEFQDTGSYVYRLYKAAYGARPTYTQFTPDRARIVGGATAEAGRVALVNEFANRAEFLTRYPASLTNTQFVDALLQTVLTGSGVDLSRERQALLDDLNANNSRARVLRLVADNASFQSAEYRRAFVLMQYFGYLRRDPDQAGYDFWLGQIAGTNPNYQGMVCSFITAREYQERFSAIFTHTNAECQ